MDKTLPLVGLVPAGGNASRISPLPCSKELIPVGFGYLGQAGELRPKVVGHYLLERMRIAGVKQAYLIVRPGKWDIPGYFKDGQMVDMDIAYLMMNEPHGVPYTLDQAYSFVRQALVVFGFPDIVFQPEDAFRQLIARQRQSRADVVLGLFEATHPQRVDMVDRDFDGRVTGIQIKPERSQLRYTWAIAVWTPHFTQFLNESVALDRKTNADLEPHAVSSKKEELYVGDILQSAIKNGFLVDSVVFEAGRYLDIGTPEDMAKVFKPNIWQPEEL